VAGDFDHWKRAVYPQYWSRTSRAYGIDHYVSGLLHLIRSVHPSDVFELAIGNGYPFAAELTTGGVAVAGSDISDLLVQECARLAPQAKAFVGGYGDQATLAAVGSRRFDVVYCFRSTWHFPDIENAIAFMLQIVKPGGRVMFDIMNSEAQWNRDVLRHKRRTFPLTIVKNCVKAIVNVVRPGSYMLDQIFGVRDIMYSPAQIERILSGHGRKFERLTRGAIERAGGDASAGDSDQKLVYVVQC
jgi:SAM-dependent methyltransferase